MTSFPVLRYWSIGNENKLQKVWTKWYQSTPSEIKDLHYVCLKVTKLNNNTPVWIVPCNLVSWHYSRTYHLKTINPPGRRTLHFGDSQKITEIYVSVYKKLFNTNYYDIKNISSKTITLLILLRNSSPNFFSRIVLKTPDQLLQDS